MTIKVAFPIGKDSVTISGLYQWNYGQVLEIEAVDLGSEIVEVHFACTNMTEAIVRPCSFSNGVGTVTIPDRCLEQTTPITAWIYRFEKDASGVGISGATVKTITIPVTARTRPSVVQEFPQEFSDKYTELIVEINEAVENLENGNITAKNAKTAENAGHANTAGNAESAVHSTSAGSATTAGNAKSLSLSGKIYPMDGHIYITEPGVYAVQYQRGDTLHADIVIAPSILSDPYYSILSVGGTLRYEYYDLTVSRITAPDELSVLSSAIKIATLED